jgi:hypothetical protein
MKKLIVSILVAVLALPVWFLGGVTAVYAEEMTCSDHTAVTIDIKPGDRSNKINLSARGLLPVAVLTTADFDASQFTPEMAHLSDASIAMSMGCVGADAVHWNYVDVNHDGQLDIVFFFRIQDLNLTSHSTAATLMAHGRYGSTDIHILGTDSVRVKRWH